MKTIKELNDPKYSDEFGYKQALKDVIKEIDEIERNCIDATEPGWSKADIFIELKTRIEGKWNKKQNLTTK